MRITELQAGSLRAARFLAATNRSARVVPLNARALAELQRWTTRVANAAGVIVGHNHPSGELQPSPEDMILCARLRNAASILGIDLLDFVIVGDGRYYSFQEAGR